MSIQAQFDLTFAEQLKANIAVTRNFIPTLIWLSLFPLCGLALSITALLLHTSITIIEGVLITLCFGFMPFMFLVNTYKAYKTQLKSGPHLYKFDSSGLQVSDRTSELKQSWKAINRVNVQSGLLLLYFTKRFAHCVPIRAFISPEQAEAIMQLASSGGVPRVGT